MRTTPREVQDFAKVKASFTLSEIQRSVLFGTLLGDGSLKRRGNYHRLHIKHSEKQISFVRYKYNIFSNITNMKINSFSQEVNGKQYRFSEFVTLTHPEFTKVYQKFYPKGKKRVNNKVVEDFSNPLGLAVWYMDDGSADYAGLSFNTQCFYKKDVDLLRILLKDRFNLSTTKRRNKNGWIIYIPKRDVSKFVNMIRPYVLPYFKYKLRPYSLRS